MKYRFEEVKKEFKPGEEVFIKHSVLHQVEHETKGIIREVSNKKLTSGIIKLQQGEDKKHVREIPIMYITSIKAVDKEEDKGIKRAFIVKRYWGEKILSGEKNIEVRGKGTNLRERVGVIYDGKIQGEVDIVGSIEFNKETWQLSKSNHRVNKEFSELKYKKPHGWMLSNAKAYIQPKEYESKKGQVVWVNIE